MWLLIFFSVTGIPLLVIGIRRNRKRSYSADGWVAGGITLLIGAVVCLIIFSISYTISVENYAKLIVFQSVYPEYETFIKRTQDAFINPEGDDLKIADGIVNLQHSKNIADRLAETREYIRWYKETLACYRRYSKAWFLRQWIARMPEELP